MLWNQFIGITMLLYALTNSVGAIPIFLAITRQAGSANIHRIIVLACTAVAVFFVGAAVLGKEILGFFNVGLNDFRIAGGLLALVIALEMFQAQYGKFIQSSSGVDRSEVDIHGMAITPFAFPLLVGPAEVSIIITLSNDNPGWLSKALLAAASISATLLIGVTLWSAAAIERFLGKTGINVITRIMALTVAAIGVNFIMTGLRSELPGLAG
ncbi:MarC family protein [Bradyrhizobium elkanii]|uniref:MarC family protein n=1 Tax=Bradyrhizobium elkanii TaxID=29448 RepID=UPI00209E3539|nr:MarC family protein [Bradyrhizobium elkanii]MCP1972966.1 multiple antibiotic resistance protein [Bradyrhizobium elkanii]MCS3520166.1 multiple antibiotic resistance protein [Bradyrhizobium elkanii]MCS4067821.1 multiple antibiotic resistance protein [Bradyrhizobium elkanii]MCS4083357.1 multiple antibiotic resistance protein [Bradyrhizobium elkanii]MCS4105527.1 multiple antibiotic resistance protein [Bradyrhizobium elkanii]